MTWQNIRKIIAFLFHVGLACGAWAQNDLHDGPTTGDSKIPELSAWPPFETVATPFHFGAAGNGVADDTRALRSLLRFSNRAWIPRGRTFLISGRLEPRSGAKIFGGGTIKLADLSNTNVIYISGKSDIWIDGITIDGNGKKQFGGNGIVAESSVKIKITNTVIKNIDNDGVLSDQTKEFEYSQNRIEEAGNHAISLSGDAVDVTVESINGIIANNIILNPRNAGINASEASHIAITGNMVLNTRGHATGHGGVRVTNGARSVSVTGNIIQGMSRGVFLIEATDCAVTGNTIEDAYFQGILIDDDATSSARNVVAGNNIRNPGTGGSAGSTAGIQISDGDDNLVAGNIITDSRSNMQHGIIETSGSTGNLIYGNRISGWTAARRSLLSEETLMAQAVAAPDGVHAGFFASPDALPVEEEATFIPTVQGSGNAGSASYAEQAGHYTRIGNRIFFDISLAWSEHTGTGDLEVHGLPIVSAADGKSATTVRSSGIALPGANGVLQAWIDGGMDVVELEIKDANGRGATGLPMHISGLLHISGSYRIK